MDQQNRLLAMLKSATTVPSSSPPPPSGPSAASGVVPPSSTSSPHTGSQSSHLAVPGIQAGSPREPSPSPPPPSLQAVSLSDLFKSIQSPPAPPLPVPSDSITSPQPLDQKKKLLGMLNTIGQPPSGATSPIGGSAVHTPIGGPEKVDPLAIFRAGHPNHPPASPTGQGPVIGHLTGHITSPPQPPAKLPSIPSIQAQNTGTSNTSSQGKRSDQPKLPAIASPAVETTPKKSMFDFVSPFDAFDQPTRSRQPSSTHPASQRPQPTQPPKATEHKIDEGGQSLARIKSIEKLGGNGIQSGRGSPQQPSTSTGVDSAKPASPETFNATNSVEVHELSQVDINDQVGKTWKVQNIVKDSEGNGPKSLTSHTTIDISKPNLDSLVATADAVQLTPTTYMRPDTLIYKKGRRVAISNDFIAYTMSKGRVRLIDSRSGARLVLQLPVTASHGPVADLAVSGNLVATIGHDKSVIVTRVSDGWAKDDPKTRFILICATANAPTGVATKVEWVKREGKPWLAIGGPQGVLIIDPSAYENVASDTEPIYALENIAKDRKTVVDFCLNHSHQAMAVLSSAGHVTLYNVANLNRVWHRSLPTASPTTEPSSIQFCESNLLVGKANNTHFDLVQITVDIAVLSTIKFISVAPAPKNLHYCQAVYDSAKSILFVAPFSRGSVYAFKYALKGQQPIKDVSKPDGPKVVAFDRVAEYPLEPVLSMVSATKGADEDAELFFATPNGFSQATIPKATCDSLISVTASESNTVPPPVIAAKPTFSSPKSPKVGGKVDLPEPSKKVKTGSVSKAASKNASPAIVKTELPSASDDEAVAHSRIRSQQGRKASVTVPTETQQESGSITEDELNKALKKTEDRLSNHLKQLLKNEITTLNVRLDGLVGPDFAADVSARVERQIKGSLSNTIAQEIKKSVIPVAATTIQNEVRTVTSNQVPAAIFDALQTVPKELERALAPVMQRTISTLVQNAMDKAVHEAVQHTLLPAMTQASSTVCDQLMTEIRSEMLQIRKELSPPNKEGQLANDHLLKNMATSISELQKQLASLSEQIRSAPAQQTPQPNGSAPPSLPPANAYSSHTHAPPPPPPQGPSPSQLEDTFLTALGAQTTASTLQLVGEHIGLTEYCLPTHGKSPLSQAVLLTLLHRLAIALTELTPGHPAFAQVAGWERRTVALLDPKDANITGYISRVLSVVQGLLSQVLSNLQRYPADPATQSHVLAIRGILDIVAHKMV
ncbi:hypothetical protein I317_02444 [Kwoniella heveanensis CBS 569]|nr:hypothetical protein I317_02444 [Kwoniella heveanensis CBS 569]